MSEIPFSPEGEQRFRPALDDAEWDEADRWLPGSSYITSESRHDTPLPEERAAVEEWQDKHWDTTLSKMTDQQQAEAYDAALLRLRVRVSRELEYWLEQNQEPLSRLPHKQQLEARASALAQLRAQGVPEHILPEPPDGTAETDTEGNEVR